MAPLQALSFERLMYPFSLFQSDLPAFIQPLHAVRQHGIVGGISFLAAMVQISGGKEPFLICHPVETGLNFGNAHSSKIKRFGPVRKSIVGRVAQVSNLLYRSASSLRMPRLTRRNAHGNVPPIGNRRYSRLETCATPNRTDFVNGT
jgi:hypothetical protein